MQRGCNMKSGVGFLAFRLCRWASVLLIILLSLLVVSCDLWNKDMLGYLKYWSETVQLGKVEVSDATIQKNDAGADTIPVAATPTIAVYVVNPQGYGLLAEIGDSSSADKSVRVSSPAVQSKAQVVAHEPTMLKVQLGSADGSLEHTEFRVDFEAIRKDTMQSSGKVMGVTLRYNTPPVAPTPVVLSYDSSQHEVVKDGETWEADRDGILYWAYDDSITKETDPNCAKWFSINGTRHPVAGCKVPDVQVDGLSVFQFKTNYGSISVAAVDSEGVSSPAVASGQAVPPATYVIKYDANGADGGTAPTSQSKTQYTDITLATNSGGLTRIGYRFTGWNTAPDGTGATYSAGAAYSADEGVTLYAKWEAVDDVVLTPESCAVNHGATVTLTPPKSDATIYYQIGGADETAGAPGQPVTVTLYNASHSPSSATGVAAGIPEGGSVTLTAHAVYADGTKSEVTTGDYRLNQYTVRYEGNGNGDAVGNVPAPQTFYSGGSVAIGGGVNRPERIGYRFTGWNTAPDGNGTPYPADATYSADESVTLYAQWEAVDAVTFSRDGAVNSGDTVQLTPPKAEVTIYYSTDGGQNWQQGQLNQSVTINLYNEKSMPQSQTGVDVGIPEGDSVTITACAKYADGTKSEVTTGTYSLNRYAVRYEGNGNTSGAVPAEQPFYSGGSVTVQEPDGGLIRLGYTRTDTWNGDDGETYVALDTYSDNADLTLRPLWTAIEYTITYDPDGGSHSGNPASYTVETSKITLSPATRPGYTFKGWYKDGSNRVDVIAQGTTGNMSLTAQWEPNTYYVRFVGDGNTGGSMVDQQFTYDQPQKLKVNAFKRTGYTFTGWKDDDGKVYTDNQSVSNLTTEQNGIVTLTAQWTYEEPNTDSSGTYEVDNHGNLLWIGQQLKSGAFKTVNLKLTADIVIPSGEWVPINLPDQSPSTFDGQGHSITFDGTSDGLFVDFNYSTIENLVLKGNITGNSAKGALLNMAYCTVICNVMSLVTITNTGTGSTGGLVGTFGGRDGNGQVTTIENCAVYADVSSAGYAGGLVGELWNGNQYGKILNSVYMGEVTGNKAGAVVGYNNSNQGSSSTLENIYYCVTNNSNIAVIGDTGAGGTVVNNVDPKTEDEIKAGGLGILGASWEVGSDGLPTLQSPSSP